MNKATRLETIAIKAIKLPPLVYPLSIEAPAHNTMARDAVGKVKYNAKFTFSPLERESAENTLVTPTDFSIQIVWIAPPISSTTPAIKAMRKRT
jgi:hypothetical protein